MKRIFAVVATFALATAAHAQVYRHVDANGNVQFTDRPPSEQQTAAEVDVSASRRNTKQLQNADYLKQQTETDRSRQQASSEQRQKSKAKAKERAKKREERCLVARARLVKFEASTHSYTVDDQGKRVYKSEQDRQQRKAHMIEAVQKSCN